MLNREQEIMVLIARYELNAFDAGILPFSLLTKRPPKKYSRRLRRTFRHIEQLAVYTQVRQEILGQNYNYGFWENE